MNSLQPKRIDLYERFFAKVAVSREQERRYAVWGFPVALAVVLAGCFGWLRFQSNRLDAQLAPVSTYLNSIESRTLYQRAVQMQADLEELGSVRGNMARAAQVVDAAPNLNLQTLGGVFTLAGESLKFASLDYESSTGVLTMTVTAASPEVIRGYVEKLRLSGLFVSVSHTGYLAESAGERYTGVVGALLFPGKEAVS